MKAQATAHDVGKFVVEANVEVGHSTFALFRVNALLFDLVKGKLVENFNNLGVTLLLGGIYLFSFFVSLLTCLCVCFMKPTPFNEPEEREAQNFEDWKLDRV